MKKNKDTRCSLIRMILITLILFPCLISLTKISKRLFVGEYSYSYKNGSYFYNEKIILKLDSHFIYTMNSEFLNEKVIGKWNIKNEKLILNSYIKEKKIIVNDTISNSFKTLKIHVRDENNSPVSYSIQITKVNSQKIIYKEQFDYTEINYKIKAFCITDTKGCKFPIYYLKNQKSNDFKVLLNPKRIFEDEIWLFKGEQIIPRNCSGYLQPYVLTKAD